jgi:hypothetical protein
MVIVKQLDFKKISKKTLKQLQEEKHMVLSTQSGNYTTSRVVSTSCHGKKIVFLAPEDDANCVQINHRPKVVLCSNKFQIEGIASNKGRSDDTANASYLKEFKEKDTRKGLEIIEVEITSIQWFGREGVQVFLEKVDFEKESVYREIPSWVEQKKENRPDLRR